MEKEVRWVPMTIAEAYKTIDEKVESTRGLLDELEQYLLAFPDPALKDIRSGPAMLVIVQDQLLQIDAFTIEMALRDLDEKRNQGCRINEDIYMLGRSAMMAADDMRASLRETGVIPDPIITTTEMNKMEAIRALDDIQYAFNIALDKLQKQKEI